MTTMQIRDASLFVEVIGQGYPLLPHETTRCGGRESADPYGW